MELIKYLLNLVDLYAFLLYYVNMENLNLIISKNLISLRKKSNLTQAQLAEKINYSDKAISKWEKGESLPNINVLMQIADFYQVKIQDIVYENKSITPKKSKIRERALVAFICTSIVWLIATISFVVLSILDVVNRAWLCFIVAIPLSFLVLSILSFRWKNPLLIGILLSFFVWTAILTISLYIQNFKTWLIYLIGCPLQLIIIFGDVLYYVRRRNKD